MILERILTLIANLIPLAGVWWWGWDVFQILVLYWMQTVLVVAWMLLHLHKLSRDKLGDITVNGRVRPATRRDLLFVFGATGFAFCGAHLLFLWLFFSGDWSKLVHGPGHVLAAHGDRKRRMAPAAHQRGRRRGELSADVAALSSGAPDCRTVRYRGPRGS